jgi:hypothetical protein
VIYAAGCNIIWVKLGLLLNPDDRRTCFSEKSVDFQRTTQSYITEDRTLHNHCCRHLKSYIVSVVFESSLAVNREDIISTYIKWIKNYVGFEVLAAVVMKISVFWYVRPCSPLKVNGRFVRTYRHHLKVQRVSRTRNQHESKWLWRCKRHVPPKRPLTFNGLQGVMSQKIELFG